MGDGAVPEHSAARVASEGEQVPSFQADRTARVAEEDTNGKRRAEKATTTRLGKVSHSPFLAEGMPRSLSSSYDLETKRGKRKRTTVCLNINRSMDDRLLQRYQNVKAELEAQQNLERIRMEKMLQSGVFTMSMNTRRKKGTGRNTAQARGSARNADPLQQTTRSTS